jgi:hypothetical protein
MIPTLAWHEHLGCVAMRACVLLRKRAVQAVLVGNVVLALSLALPADTQAHRWSTLTIDSETAVGRYASMAVDASGDPMISYLEFTGGNLKFAICDWSSSASGDCSQAAEWSTVAADSEGAMGWFTSVAVDGSGDPMIAYQDWTDGELRFAICDRSASTNGNCNRAGDWRTETLDAVGNVGYWTSITADASGDPMISYLDAAIGLKFAICNRSSSTNGNCDQASDWRNLIVDSAGKVGEYTSIAVDGNGDPMISYRDATNADLKFATCDRFASTNGNCDQASDWKKLIVDSAGDVGEYTSIAVDGDGDPMISYRGGTNADLKFATCNRSASTNGSCDQTSDWREVTVDSAGDVGWSTSVAVDGNGDPMISYHEDTGWDLKFAMCDLSESANGNCDRTGDWSTETVDSEGDVGRYNSIAVDATGNAIIAYNDDMNWDLRFAIASPSSQAATSTSTPTPIPTATPAAARTATPPASPVGGGTPHPDLGEGTTDRSGSGGEGVGPSGRDYTILAGGIAAVVLAAAAGAWYARRRWLR